MNQWFRRHAWTNHAAGISRTNVICNTETAGLTWNAAAWIGENKSSAASEMLALLLCNGVGKNLFVDEIEISAHATQVANGRTHHDFQRQIVRDPAVPRQQP